MADAAAELDEGGVVRTLKDLFAGAAGGIAQVLLGEFEAQNCFLLRQLPLCQQLHITSRVRISGGGEGGVAQLQHRALSYPKTLLFKA